MRAYLNAIVRGDDGAAYAAFGAAPGASGIELIEKQYLDPTTHIERITATPTSQGATVDVDLNVSGKVYFAEYSLTRNAAGAAVIRTHTIVKS